MVEQINPRTQLGGGYVSYAMCLDNTQRRDGAGDVQAVRGEPHGQVSKQADQMIWGMTSAANNEGGSVRLRRGEGQVRSVPHQDDDGATGLEDSERSEEEEALQKMTGHRLAAIPLRAAIAFAR